MMRFHAHYDLNLVDAHLITEGRGSLKGVVVNKTQETGFNCEFLLAAQQTTDSI